MIKTKMKADAGSFRDPAGQVFVDDGNLFRLIKESGLQDFKKVHDSGFLQQLIQEEKLVDYKIVEHQENSLLLQLKTIPFISYPYEWSFIMLKQAALLQLELHLSALEHTITLIDASPFNIQFIGNKPIFIDHLSFRPYEAGDIWWGHQQFCQLFLAPLLLQYYRGLDFQNLLRSNLEGITLMELNRLLPARSKLNWKVFFHIYLQAKLQNKSSQNNTSSKPKKISLPKSALINLLKTMHTWVGSLAPNYLGLMEWQVYNELHLYSDKALTFKKKFIAAFCQKTKVNTLWDLGCNQGEYAKVALEQGVNEVLGFDIDTATVDKAYTFSKKEQLNFLPLYMNFANPSPAQGWNQQERQSLLQRNNAEALLALALIHHLRIQHNIPLSAIIDYLLLLAPQGIIEFIPKSDPKVQLLLRYRKDIFEDYSFENFKKLLCSKATILEEKLITDTERCLVWYKINE